MNIGPVDCRIPTEHDLPAEPFALQLAARGTTNMRSARLRLKFLLLAGFLTNFVPVSTPGAVSLPDSLATTGGPRSTPSVSESGDLRVVGHWLFGPSYAVRVADDIAYFGEGVMLNIMDFSLPASPEMVTRVTLPDEVEDLEIADGFVYLANGDAGVTIVDARTPASAHIVGRVDATSAVDVAVSGNLACVARYVAGVLFVDITDKSQPQVLSTYAPGLVRGVALAGNHLYAIDPYEGYRTVDVTDPMNPVLLVHKPSFLGFDVTLVGDRAFLASSPMRILDISDPSLSTQVGSVAVGGVRDVAVSGDYAYVATVSDAGVVDISDETHPVKVGAFNPSREVYGVAVSNDLLFVANYINCLYVRDVSVPANPAPFYHYDTGDDLLAITAANGLLYIADRYAGIKVMDVGNPTRPRVIGSFDTPSWANDVTIEGMLAYVPDGIGGLRILEVSDPTQIPELGFFTGSAWAYAIAVRAGVGYLADRDAGLRILDVANPAQVAELGFFDDNSYDASANDVALAGDYALLANGYNGLRIIDVSDPANPFEPIPRLNPSYASHVVVSGSSAYYTGGVLREVFTTILPNYFEIGGAPLGGAGLAVSSEHIYMASGYDGLRVLSRTTFSLDDQFPTASIATDVAVLGDLICVISEGEGMFVLEHVKPVPTQLQSFALISESAGIRARWTVGNELDVDRYVLTRRIQDGPERNVATVAAVGETGYDALDLNVSPGAEYDYRLIAVDSDGTQSELGSRSMRFEPALVLSLQQNSPNPFNPSTEIRFILPEAADVELAVYDVAGRFVVRLVDERLPFGAGLVRWDGRDARGRPVASGVYIYRLRAGKTEISRKMTLLR